MENNNIDELYFADAFSLNSNGINLTVNNLTANCISSSNNKFNIDENGNLVANSITLLNNPSPSFNNQDIINLIYPVGSIYISVNEVNPEEFIGGVWASFATGRTIVGVDISQTEFNEVEKTGGHKELQSHNHAASTNSTGAHTHHQDNRSAISSSSGTPRMESWSSGSGTDRAVNTGSAGAHTHTVTINNTGAGNAGNLQPFITVYMFKRVE